MITPNVRPTTPPRDETTSLFPLHPAALSLGSAVARALGRVRGVRMVGAGRWEVPLAQRVVHVRLQRDWLHMESGAVVHADDWDLLRRNATLSPSLKFGRHGHRGVVLRGEVRLDAGTAAVAPRALLAEMRAGLDGRRAARPAFEKNAMIDATAEALAAYVTATGWEPITRSDATCSVAVNSRGARHDVALAMNGRITGEIEIARLQAPLDVRRAAMSHLLLLACGRMRGVKACVTDPDDTGEFRVTLRAQSYERNDTGVSVVLESLSAACLFFGREAVALARDAALAHAYLQRTVRADGPERATDTAA